jgi:hypothetical protein
MPSKRDPLPRLRKLCLALPEAHEVEAWQAPTWRVRNKTFAIYADPHHNDDHAAVWIKAAPGNNELMVATDPQRFFIPAYVGPSGWVGVRLDVAGGWDDLVDLLRDGYNLVAPKRLAGTQVASRKSRVAKKK